MKHGILSLPSSLRMSAGKLLARSEVQTIALHVARALLGFTIAQGVTFGEYSPFGLGFVAVMAGKGVAGITGALGVLLGFFRIWTLTDSVKYAAGALLVYTAVASFRGTRIAAKRFFAPTAAALAVAAVGFVFVLGRGFGGTSVALFLCEVALVFGFTYFAGEVFNRDANRRTDANVSAFCALSVIAAAALGLSQFSLFAGMSVGRIAAVLIILCAAGTGGVSAGAAAGVTLGVVFDIGGGSGFYSMSYGLAGLLAGAVAQGGRFACATAYVLAGGVLVLADSGGAPRFSALYETFAASIIYILLPDKIRLLPGVGLIASGGGTRSADSTDGGVASRLKAAAGAFIALSGAMRNVPSPVRPSAPTTDAAFRRAAQRACARCPKLNECVDTKTHAQLAQVARVLRERASIEAGDLPDVFVSNCVKPADFARAVSEEYRICQVERRRTERVRRQVEQAGLQYTQVAALLSDIAQRTDVPSLPHRQVFDADISAASRRRKDSEQSGDCGTWFKAPRGEVVILLSDGMGSGEAAAAASEEMLRLVQEFMMAGVTAQRAVEAVSGALAARGGDVFATLDLLSLDLHSGAGEIIKCGAAPTYLCGGGSVCRVTGGGLPPGADGAEPSVRHFDMTACNYIVMITDGVADGVEEDDWLRGILQGFDGDDSKALALAVLTAAAERTGEADDISVVAVRVK